MNDLLLLACMLDGPKHGYALKKRAAILTGQPDLHNNVVYPSLRRFVEAGWVSRRSAQGQRGQTREMYSLTARGKRELQARLSEFSHKDAASENAFRFRVGLFAFLSIEVQRQILNAREQWLTARDGNLALLQQSISLGDWGGEVVRFMRAQIKTECSWLAALAKKSSRVARRNTRR